MIGLTETVRLFDIDSKIKDFDAVVISCEKKGEKFETVLDQTAFFPEEGGQFCDSGKIENVCTVSVEERDRVIYHITDSKFEIGQKVHCSIDFDERFRKMQNHTGEHIVSGTIHRLFGFNNIGFHLGRDDMTADFDGILTAEALRTVEQMANKAVYDCRRITAYYPTESELENITYRSKSEIDGKVRIVDIEGVDICACCAPHVSNTGEVGIIKILDHMRFKGGTRIHIRCGYDALDDYRDRYNQIYSISTALSLKQKETADGVAKFIEADGKLKGKISALKKELRLLKLNGIHDTEANICIFDDDDDINSQRELVNLAVKKCGGICALFSGNDSDGYRYIIASENADMKKLAPALNKALFGRGGGSSEMICGSCNASKTEIEAVVSAFDIDQNQ